VTAAARTPPLPAPLLPAPLRAGDPVAVVAPCGPVQPDQLAAGVEQLSAWGYRPVVMPHALEVHGHLAGTDDARAADLDAALRDPELRAVWVARGGYGLTRILDRVGWEVLARDPKPIVGFSDATALHLAAWARLRLVTFHAQFAARAHLLARHADAATHLRALLAGEVPAGPLPALDGEEPPRVVAGGRGEGRLLGGNLTLLASTIGTPAQLDTAGAVLLVEEVGEEPYAIDRSLTQLRTAGLLDDVAGVIVGRLRGCDPVPKVPAGGGPLVTPPSASADEVVAERLGDLGVPVLADLPVGHVDRQLALPHGGRVRLDAEAGTVELLERVTC
jgi:muramoyltetrapeptide carboxypeptidase